MKAKAFVLSQTLVSLAVAAAFAPAYAQVPPGLTVLPDPGTYVSLGAGYVSGDQKDRARFGQYNGLRDHSGSVLLNFGYLNTDSQTGRWNSVEGRNLGLDDREVRFQIRKLGDWNVTGEYSELVRRDVHTINTNSLDLGSNTPTVRLLTTPGTGNEVNLELKRKAVTLAGEKWFGGSLKFETSFRNEDKNGGRLWGRGFACSAAWQTAGLCSTTTQFGLLSLPEPVDSNIKQFDAKLNYSGANFLLTGGYYGSFYDNSNSALMPTIATGLRYPAGTATAMTDTLLPGTLALPLALPPDNQAHQFYLQGNYAFTQTTHATFKYAYTHATQDQSFPAGLNTLAPRSSLGGEVNTTLAQAGISARPMPKLSLLANVRYEDKDNRTPVALYNVEGVTTWTNNPLSPKRLNAKVEGSYLLPANYRAVLGVDYEAKDHGSFTQTSTLGGISGIRQKTTELGYRAELRKTMSASLNGSVAYVHSKRDGNSSWLKPATAPATGVVAVDTSAFAPNNIFPSFMQDLTRDKVRLVANWSPQDRVSLQFIMDEGKDKFDPPISSAQGLKGSRMSFYSADAAFALNDAWKLTAFYSHSNQAINVGHSTGYRMDLGDEEDNFGLGAVGKLSERLQVGGDLSSINEKNKYKQNQDAGVSTANLALLGTLGGLPDITYRLLRTRLYGEYALVKNQSVRLDFVHQTSFLNDWTWGLPGTPFLYADNTSVTFKQNQSVNFVAATYLYRF